MDKQTAQRILQEWTIFHWEGFRKIFPGVLQGKPLPIVEINTRTSVRAGSCEYAANKLEYSLKLYSIPKNWETFHNVIVPHEIAHMVTYYRLKKVMGRFHHCPVWKDTMVQYKLPPNPYHDMEKAR